jgi:hypothetical protein
MTKENNMKVEWIEYKNNKILYVEYSGAQNDADLINILHQEVEIERKLSNPILCLVNVSNAHASARYMSELKKLGKEVRNQKVSKTATLGVTGLKQILFNAYVKFTGEINKPFDDENSAKEWLIS